MNKITLAKVLIRKKLDGIKFLLARAVTGQGDTVLFESFDGTSYSDNPRFISEKLHELYPDTEIVWAFRDPSAKKAVVPDYVRTIKRDESFGFFKELASCRVWVNNGTFRYVPKRKGQFFIQTWHGDRAFKKVLNDSGHRDKFNKVSEGIEGYCDLAVCGSSYGEKQYRSAFGYTGKILMEGTPRDDCLIAPDPDRIRETKQKLGVADDAKILLFAPTFRQNNLLGKTKQETSGIDISRILDVLEEKYGGEWKALLRAHPRLAGLTGNSSDPRITDATGYEDMADLLPASDVLITDFSSSAGDFALLKRPVLLYQPDKKEYESNERALYFKMEDSPFFAAESQQELEDIIRRVSEADVKENCEKILEFYGTRETGKSSEKIAGIIHDVIAERSSGK